MVELTLPIKEREDLVVVDVVLQDLILEAQLQQQMEQLTLVVAVVEVMVVDQVHLEVQVVVV